MAQQPTLIDLQNLWDQQAAAEAAQKRQMAPAAKTSPLASPVMGPPTSLAGAAMGPPTSLAGAAPAQPGIGSLWDQQAADPNAKHGPASGSLLEDAARQFGAEAEAEPAKQAASPLASKVLPAGPQAGKVFQSPHSTPEMDKQFADAMGTSLEESKRRIGQTPIGQGVYPGANGGLRVSADAPSVSRPVPPGANFGTATLASPVMGQGDPQSGAKYGSVAQAAGAQSTFPSSFATGPLSSPYARELANDNVMKNGGQVPDQKGPIEVRGGRFTPGTVEGWKSQDDTRAFQQSLADQFPTMKDIQANLQGPSNYLVHGGEKTADQNNATYLQSLGAYSKMMDAKNGAFGIATTRDLGNARLGLDREIELGPRGKQALGWGNLANEQQKTSNDALKYTPEFINRNATATAIANGLIKTVPDAEVHQDILRALSPAGPAGGGGPPKPSEVMGQPNAGTHPEQNLKRIASAIRGSLPAEVDKAISTSVGTAAEPQAHNAITSIASQFPDADFHNRDFFASFGQEMQRKFGNHWSTWQTNAAGGNDPRAIQRKRLNDAYMKHTGGTGLDFRRWFFPG